MTDQTPVSEDLADGSPYCEPHGIWHVSGPEHSCEAWDRAATVTADVEVLRTQLNAILREYESIPYGDLRLNAERAVAKVLTAIEEHPVLGIRPYYPTQDAYDATCRALEKHRKRADQAEASIARVHDVHYSITREGKQWCNACSSITGHHYMPHPCPTIRALNEPAQQGDARG